MFRKLEWKAILAGVITNLGSTLLTVLVYLANILYKHIDVLRAADVVYDFGFTDSHIGQFDYFYWGFFGSVCSILGGIVTGRVARQSPYINSVAAAFVILLIGSLFINGNTHILYVLLPYIVTIPLFLLGAWLTKKYAKPHHHTS